MSIRRNKRQTEGAGMPHGIQVVAKPIGPVCNLNCEYCFYFEKQALFAANEKYRMSDEVLSAADKVRQYEAQRTKGADTMKRVQTGAHKASRQAMKTDLNELAVTRDWANLQRST